jgi:hypothetical protein
MPRGGKSCMGINKTFQNEIQQNHLSYNKKER